MYPAESPERRQQYLQRLIENNEEDKKRTAVKEDEVNEGCVAAVADVRYRGATWMSIFLAFSN